MRVLYEKPLRIELEGGTLFVNGKPHKRDVRRLLDMKDVLKAYVVPEASGNPDLYYMFRKVCEKEGKRFDITLILPKVVEGECAKTYGHSHPVAEDALGFPEVYQVLGGSAVFLLQQWNRDRSVNVSMIRAGAGDSVIIPPNFAHVTINPGEDELVLANVVADNFESDYSDFSKNRGAAFYYLPDGNIEQNANYVVKALERPKAADFNRRFGFECRDLLSEFVQNPGKFDFLLKPSLMFRKQQVYKN